MNYLVILQHGTPFVFLHRKGLGVSILGRRVC